MKILVIDIDGTTYDSIGFANWVLSIAVNRKTNKLLVKHSIPLFVNSGGDVPQLKTKFLGFNPVSCFIKNHGTEIYFKEKNGSYEIDKNWYDKMSKSTIEFYKQKKNWREGTEIKNKISKTVREIFPFLTRVHPDRKFSLEFFVKGISILQLKLITNKLQSIAGEKNKVIYSESFLGQNTREKFCGTIVIIPKIAGKFEATKYAANSYALKTDSKNLEVHTFGDSMGDLEFVSKHQEMGNITWFPHVVNPSPLLVQALSLQHPKAVGKSADIEKLQKQENEVPFIHKMRGSEAILDVVQAVTGEAPNPRNSIWRYFLVPIYPILRLLYPRDISADHITELSMKYISEAVTSSGDGSLSVVQILWRFLKGYAGDLVDGYVARQNKNRTREDEKRGQLLDGFRDRLVEALQLGFRAQKRIAANPKQGLETLEAMVSCVLPGMSRAETEFVSGRAVSEDGRGSMRARTIRLTRSLINTLFQKDVQALNLDREILAFNLEIFKERISESDSIKGSYQGQDIRLSDFADQGLPIQMFRRDALERFFLYRRILSDFNQIAIKLINSTPDSRVILEQYNTWLDRNNIKTYLAPYPDEMRVSILNDPKLRITSYISVENGRIKFSLPPK